jgi:hypothetical protein
VLVADAKEAEEKGLRLKRVVVYPNPEQLRQIAELIDAGTVKPHVSATFPLAQAAEAHRLVETGRVQGKVVLAVVRPSLLETLAAWQPLQEEFPDIDDQPPLADLNL